jgi:hypothetical protein
MGEGLLKVEGMLLLQFGGVTNEGSARNFDGTV